MYLLFGSFSSQPFIEGRESDELHFRHSGLKCFSVRIRLVSSIFSQDEHIYSFLHTFPNSKVCRQRDANGLWCLVGA
jgi:hypothetical protein